MCVCGPHRVRKSHAITPPNPTKSTPHHQVTAEIESLGQYLEPKLRIKCCVGSPNVKTEEARDERIALVKSLKTEPPHVLVGTMGRVCDLAEGRDRSGPVIWCVKVVCSWCVLGWIGGGVLLQHKGGAFPYLLMYTQSPRPHNTTHTG